MNKGEFLTISNKSKGFLKEKGSKFISYAFPISDEDDVKSHLAQLKKEYHDARHICYAYRLGTKSIYERASDDGEPNNSAGQPILGQIKSKALHNTLVAVVRYFGGTKLGVGGLVQAYRTSAQLALNEARIIKKVIAKSFTITFPYEETNSVMKVLRDYQIHIKKQSFMESCKIHAEIPETFMSSLIESFELNKNILVSFEKEN